MKTLAMGGVSTVRVVGGVLPSDVVGRALAGDLPGMAAGDYHLASGERISAAAARSWDYLLGAYASFRSTLSAQPDRVATGLTREKWLLLLLRELGYGRVPTTSGSHMTAGADGDVRQYPISHLWADVPIHLMGWGIDLDRRTEGVAGAARAPQAMVQEFLNRSGEHLWALVSNGRVLRMLRDSSALVGQAYIEFDLEAMFDGELFSDFVALYTMCHQSRLELLSGDDPIPVTNRWIERWRENAISTGTRALQDLRRGVEQAIEVLGTGFYQNPANTELRDRLANGEVSANDFQRALLRQAYRLLFWFVIEDRGLLFDPSATEGARDRYTRYFSSARLRQQARRSPGSRHHDLWRQVQLVQRGLASVDGLPELGLPGMGGLFDKTALDVTDACDLDNSHLLTAMRLLSTTRDKSGTRTVDFAHLGAEELGGIYEGLLELHPSLDAGTGEFRLTTGSGHERKTSGSYYTPSDLIALVLDEALDPVLEEAGHDEQALLSVTVCDPACGSGHFLVAAARRIAVRVAAVRSGESEPTPTDVQAALRDVVARCIYGVDLNPMAAELAKVSLWLEAVEPGKPMAFLDANIRVGNALLGATPGLMTAGVPDEAFVALTGDDKKVVAALKKENKRQRQQAERGEHHDTLFGGAPEAASNRGLAARIREITTGLADASLSEIHQAAKRLSDFEGSPERQQVITTADAWCAAFTQPKTAELEQIAVTDEVVRALAAGSGASPGKLALIHAEAVRHRFFHWHLEFPQIFVSGGAASPQGWSGGFTVVVGNPPYLDSETMTAESPRDRAVIEALYCTARGNWDLFIPFVQLADDRVGYGGRHAMVTKASLLGSPYAAALQDYLCREATPLNAYDLSDRDYFEGASVPVAILSVEKKPAERRTMSVRSALDPHPVTIDLQAPAPSGFRFTAIPANPITEFRTVLRDLTSAFDGATTSEAYLIREILQDSQAARRNSVRLINTGLIDPFTSFWGERDCKYLKRSLRYPTVSLEELAAISSRRAEQARSPKVILAGLSSRIEAFVDSDGSYLCGKSAIQLHPQPGVDCFALAAYLNSSVVSDYYRDYFGSSGLGKGSINYSPKQILQIPCPDSDFFQTADRAEPSWSVDEITHLLSSSTGVKFALSALGRVVAQRSGYTDDLTQFDLDDIVLRVIQAAS